LEIKHIFVILSVAGISFLSGLIVGGTRGDSQGSSAPSKSNVSTDASSTDDSNSNSNVDGLSTSNFKTLWIMSVPTGDGSEMCVPAVSFEILNSSSENMSELKFEGSFLNSQTKTSFGSGEVFWDAPELPPGYHGTILLSSTQGLTDYSTGGCPATLPPLNVSITFQNEDPNAPDNDEHDIFDGSVDQTQSLFFGFVKYDQSNLPDSTH